MRAIKKRLAAGPIDTPAGITGQETHGADGRLSPRSGGAQKSGGAGADAPTPPFPSTCVLRPRACDQQGSTAVQAMPQLPQSVYCALGTGQSYVQAMPQVTHSE